MFRSARALTALGALLVPGLAADADVVLLSAEKDNTLYQDATGSTSNGLGDAFFVGRTASFGVRRGLLAFDLASAIPAGSIVTAVRLDLYVTRTVSGATPIGLHRVTRDWGEGASAAVGAGGAGTSAEPGDATWLNTFFPSENWATPGGDFVALASGSTSVSNFEVTWTSSPGMVADAQSWLDNPATNFGWLLKSPESVRDAKRFGSRENEDPTQRPVLTVTFTPVPEPAGFSLAALGALALARRARSR
ncbi:MAG: DNRLRE domain-containing protein [Phycisphaerae bacterium]